jgi:hypothetical protein
MPRLLHKLASLLRLLPVSVASRLRVFLIGSSIPLSLIGFLLCLRQGLVLSVKYL